MMYFYVNNEKKFANLAHVKLLKVHVFLLKSEIFLKKVEIIY